MKLKFEEKIISNKGKSFTYHYVKNSKGEVLGNIAYSKPWKCWVWEQDEWIMMSSDCLQQVVDYLKRLDSG
jgi:lipopolysaccharide biosynthesis glycosyltransferase